MKAKGTNISRRDLLAAGALSAAGLAASALIPTQQAHADESEARSIPTPAIAVQIKDKEGKVVDSYNPLSRISSLTNPPIKVKDASCETKANSDGSFTVVSNSTIALRNADTTAEESYQTENASATVSINYIFSRGQITVQSGSANITWIASNVNMYSRYLIVAQGPYTGTGDTIVEQFTGNTHTIITNFGPIEYVPSGATHMNICRFESAILINGTEDYFFDVEVTV